MVSFSERDNKLFTQAAQNWTQMTEDNLKLLQSRVNLFQAHVEKLDVTVKLELISHLTQIEKTVTGNVFTRLFLRIFPVNNQELRISIQEMISQLRGAISGFQTPQQRQLTFNAVQDIEAIKKQRYERLFFAALPEASKQHWYNSWDEELQNAIKNKEIDRAMLCLHHIEIRDWYSSQTYLKLAAESGNIDMVKLLVAKDAFAFVKGLCTALWEAETPEIIRYLLSQGALVHPSNFEDFQHWCKKNYPELGPELVAAGLPPDYELLCHQTYGDQTLVKAYFAGTLDDALKKEFRVRLQAALAQDGRITDLIPSLGHLDEINPQGETALVIAAKKGWDKAIKILLQSGANPAKALKILLTAGHHAAAEKFFGFITPDQLDVETIKTGLTKAIDKHNQKWINRLIKMLTPGELLKEPLQAAVKARNTDACWQILERAHPSTLLVHPEIPKALKNALDNRSWELVELLVKVANPQDIEKLWRDSVPLWMKSDPKPPLKTIQAFLSRCPTLDWAGFYEKEKPLLHLEAQSGRSLSVSSIDPKKFPETFRVKLSQEGDNVECNALLLTRGFSFFQAALLGMEPGESELDLSSFKLNKIAFTKVIDHLSNKKRLPPADFKNPDIAKILHVLDARGFELMNIDRFGRTTGTGFLPSYEQPWKDFQFAWDEQTHTPTRAAADYAIPLEKGSLPVHSAVLQSAGILQSTAIKNIPTLLIPKETPPDTVNNLLRFLYCRELNHLSEPKQVLDCITLAKQWGVSDRLLADLGTDYLNKMLPAVIQGKGKLANKMQVGEIDFNAVKDLLSQLTPEESIAKMAEVAAVISPLNPPRLHLHQCTFLPEKALQIWRDFVNR